MTRNPVMNLWTAIVTAFLTLLTSLGLITTTAAAAVPEAGTARNTNAPQDAAAQEGPIRAWPPHARSLPPTMKQRIHAEAHGSSPSCRHRPPTDTTATDTAVPHDSAPPPAATRPSTSAASATATAAIDTTDSATTAGGATNYAARDTAAAQADPIHLVGPVGPSGTTRATTGLINTGTAEARPATELGGELPTRTRATAVACTPTAPAVVAAPVAAVILPSQPSAPIRLPAPASAPVLTAADAATPG